MKDEKVVTRDWRGRKLPPPPPWEGYIRPDPRMTLSSSAGRGGPLDFLTLEARLGRGYRVLYEVDPKSRRRVLLSRLVPPAEQVVIVSDILNGHVPRFPQTVAELPTVGITTDFRGLPLPDEAKNSDFVVRTSVVKGGRSLHDYGRRLKERGIQLLWEAEPDLFKHTARKFVVFCERCKSVWSALASNLDGRNSRCPTCAASKSSRIEEMCRRYFRLVFGDCVSARPCRGVIKELSVSFKGKKVKVGRPELDIVIELPVNDFKRIAVEVHGEQHYRRGWSGSSPEWQIAKDRAKAAACGRLGILLIEIPYGVFDGAEGSVADAIRARFNQAAGRRMITNTVHKRARAKLLVDDFDRLAEIKDLQFRLKRKIDTINLEVTSPIEEVIRTSSRLRIKCPNCNKERTLAASSILTQSGLCRPCSKVVPIKGNRSEFWKSVEGWCSYRGFRLLSQLSDYDGRGLKADKFYFLDEKGQLRSVFCFTVARPIVESLRARTLVPIENVPHHIAERVLNSSRNTPPHFLGGL